MSILLSIIRFVQLYIDYLVDIILRFKNGNGRSVPAVKNKVLLLSATQMARQVREGALKSRELVEAHIKRIVEVNGIINAVVDERFAEALKEADEIDQGIETGRITEDDFKLKPFLGVPFTTKESVHCKGLKITFGLVPRKNEVAEEDSDVIKTLKESGAILLAITNVPQLCLWIETHNPVYGKTNNPYNTSRNVGGSSGGEAALIAACGSPLGLGTDIGGSIRIPCYMCGLFGHKPSPHLISTKGLTYKDGSESDNTMVVAGPMTRHAEDLIPGLKAIIGPAHNRLKLDTHVDVKKLKYYYIIETGDVRITAIRPDVKKAFYNVVNHFKTFADIQELSLDNLKHVFKLYKHCLGSEKNSKLNFDITGRREHATAFNELYKFIRGKGELDFAAVLVLLSVKLLPMPDAQWAETTLNNLKKELLDTLGNDGVLIYVSGPIAAGYHHGSYFRLPSLSTFSVFSALKVPVTQVPLGLNNEGLPLGVQIVASPYNDHLTIAVAKELERTFGGYVPPFNM